MIFSEEGLWDFFTNDKTCLYLAILNHLRSIIIVGYWGGLLFGLSFIWSPEGIIGLSPTIYLPSPDAATCLPLLDHASPPLDVGLCLLCESRLFESHSLSNLSLSLHSIPCILSLSLSLSLSFSLSSLFLSDESPAISWWSLTVLWVVDLLWVLE